MKPLPILFLSDAPSLPTGLARITKDLAIHVSSLPQFRVGTIGRGCRVASKLPFVQYVFDERDQWGEAHIQDVWNDFAGSDIGIIFSIWDPSRLDWLARPRMGGPLQEFLTSGRFQKWAYLPVDSHGIGGRLTGMVQDTLTGFHRVLAYTMYGKMVLNATTGIEVDWIPHGFNADIFQPRDRTAARMAVGLKDNDILVGCVMTNQARKDWGTAFGAIAHLKNRIPTLKFWAHIDVVERHWNLMALMHDFGLADITNITFNGDLTSEQLSYAYSACDITMLPSLGEGFGFPIVESMACGVPCIHGNYGGGVELMPDKSWLVNPVAERLDGMWNNIRPVWNPLDWCNTLYSVLQEANGGALKDVSTNAVEHLKWTNLWPSMWKKFFLTAIE